MKSTQKPPEVDLTDEELEQWVEYDNLDPELCHYLLEDMNRLGMFEAWKSSKPLTPRSMWFLKCKVLTHLDRIIQACSTPVIH